MLPLHAQNRYESNKPGSIVAKAREELEDFTAVPKSRMGDGLRKGHASMYVSKMQGNSKISIGLPLMKIDASLNNASLKNLNYSGTDRISLFRNEDERQNVLEQANQHQANY